jgi:hypothetical protein|tara:strand:- start:294 stop:935 length:642 start_codon:yes stop_codon:yes gene_type:complete
MGVTLNVTKCTENYVDQRPDIRACLLQNLLNFSKVARAIQKEHDIKNFEAIVIALRRFQEKIQKKEENLQPTIKQLLKDSTMEIKNKVMVTIVPKSTHPDTLEGLEKTIRKDQGVYHLIQGTTTLTIVTQEVYKEKIKKLFENKIISMEHDLVDVTLKSDESVETAVGFLAYLTTLMAHIDINIIEILSAWTDTVIIIHKDDLSKMMELTKLW